MDIQLTYNDVLPAYRASPPREVTFDMLTPEAQAAIENAGQGVFYAYDPTTIDGIPRDQYPMLGPVKVFPVLALLIGLGFAIWAAVSDPRLLWVIGTATFVVYLLFRHIKNQPDLVKVFITKERSVSVPPWQRQIED